jgi:hypothetical protein
MRMPVRAAATLAAVLCAGGIVLAQTPVTGVFFNEGWESGAFSTFNSQTYGNAAQAAQMSVQTAVRATGTYAFRQIIPASSPTTYVTQHFGDSIAGPVLANGRGQHFQDLYVQYKVYYAPGFVWGNGYKQLIIGTQDDRRHEETCCNPWVAHYLTIYTRGQGELLAEGNNKQATSGMWVGMGPNLNGRNRDNPYLLQTGRWYTIEVRRRLNDAGVDNGIFQMWVDGEMVADWRTIRWRVPPSGSFGSNFTYGTNFVMLSNYTDPPVAQEQRLYYDDVKFSTTYIGTATAPTAPSAPTGVRILTS